GDSVVSGIGSCGCKRWEWLRGLRTTAADGIRSLGRRDRRQKKRQAHDDRYAKSAGGNVYRVHASNVARLRLRHKFLMTRNALAVGAVYDRVLFPVIGEFPAFRKSARS